MTPAKVQSIEAALVPAELAPLVELVHRLVQALETKPIPETRQAIWITLEDAAQYTGLSEGLLRRLIHAKLIVGLKDGRMKVRKADLDSFDPSLVGKLPPARPGGWAYSKRKK